MSPLVGFLVALVAIYVICAVPLNLMQGYAGLLSLALASSFGVGAYAFAIGEQRLGLPFFLALLLAAALCAAVQIVITYPSVRVSGLYLVLATLGFQNVLAAIYNNWTSVTGGASGIFGLHAPSVAGFALNSYGAFATVSVVVALLAIGVTYWLAHSPFGLSLRGVEQDEVAMSAYGYDVVRLKVGAALYFGAWAGIAGALYALIFESVNPLSFDLLNSILFQAFIIVGGTANFWGPVIGVALLVGLPQGLQMLPNFGLSAESFARDRDIIYGAVLILLMRYRPQGIWSARIRDAGPTWTWGSKPVKRPDGSPPVRLRVIPAHAEAAPQRPSDEIALSLEDVHVSFGGIRALQGGLIEIPKGKITGVIGPNGAGKSTLFNAATGHVRLQSGVVRLNGRPVADVPKHLRVRLGLVRTFQDLRLYDEISVQQNVALGALGHSRGIASSAVDEALELFGLGEVAGMRAGSLSYGVQKRVSLARVLAAGAETVLLDEPASGLSPAELEEMIGLILRFKEMGKTVCLVEHNMEVIRALSDKVYAMHLGRPISAGEAVRVLNDPTVLSVYLGEAE